MTKPEIIRRRIAQVSLVENSEHLIDVPRARPHDILGIMVALSGNLVVAGAAATSVPTESPAGLISRIDLVADGKDVLEQVPFVFATHGNYQRRFESIVTAPGTAVATHPFKAVGMLDRINVDGLRPRDSAFQAWLSSLLQLRITTGTVDDIVTKGAATVSLSNTQIEVVLITLKEQDKDVGEPKTVKKRTVQSQTFTGANSNFRFDLPVGNLVRLVELHATDDGDPSDSLINSIEVSIEGVDVRHNTTYDAARYLNEMRKQVSVPSGFVVIDATEDDPARQSHYWDLRGASLAEVALDIAAPTGTGKVEMVVEESIVPGS